MLLEFVLIKYFTKYQTEISKTFFRKCDITLTEFLIKKKCRHLPNPCKAFYTARLHDQSWVRGDYSDVMVTMSRVYEVIRGDEKIISNDNEKQVLSFFICFIFCIYFIFIYHLFLTFRIFFLLLSFIIFIYYYHSLFKLLLLLIILIYHYHLL